MNEMHVCIFIKLPHDLVNMSLILGAGRVLVLAFAHPCLQHLLLLPGKTRQQHSLRIAVMACVACRGKRRRKAVAWLERRPLSRHHCSHPIAQKLHQQQL